MSSASDEPSPEVFLGEIVLTHYRLATRANVMEQEAFILTLARLMPPQTSLRQALAFVMIGRAHVSGERVTAASISRLAGFDAKKEAVFGPALKRTLKALFALGLISQAASEEDLRAMDLKLTAAGLSLLREAMDLIS